MKKFFFTLIAGVISVQAIEITGEANLTKAFFYEDSISPVGYMFHEIAPKFSVQKENYEFFSSLKLRIWDKNLPTSLNELSNFPSPFEIYLWELYGKIYGFILSDLDLKFGRQRIVWGTADKLNPTDNLNPYDLQNPLNFGERMPQEALLLNYYFPNELTLSIVFEPYFTPPLLPNGEFPLYQFLAHNICFNVWFLTGICGYNLSA